MKRSTLVAIGLCILAVGSSRAAAAQSVPAAGPGRLEVSFGALWIGQLALGSFLIVGFMIHNVTEGLGIATAATEERRVSVRRLALLVLVAGGPAILGTWLGGYVRNDVLGVLFFAAAAGAAFEVVIEVGGWLRTRAPGGLTSGWVLGGFLAGVSIMYVTGVLAG